MNSGQHHAQTTLNLQQIIGIKQQQAVKDHLGVKESALNANNYKSASAFYNSHKSG